MFSMFELELIPLQRDEGDKAKTLDLAYERALSAEDTIARRYDSMDARLQMLLTFIVSTTAVVPSIAKQTAGLRYYTWPFLLAIAAAFVAIVLATYARSTGELLVFDPAELEKHWLRLPEAKFKKYMIRKAANAFDRNTRLY